MAVRRSPTSTELPAGDPRGLGPLGYYAGCEQYTTTHASPAAALVLRRLEKEVAASGDERAASAEAIEAVKLLAPAVATRFRVRALDADDATLYGPSFFEEPPWRADCALRWIAREQKKQVVKLRSPQGRVLLGLEFDVASSCSLLGRDHTRRELQRALRYVATQAAYFNSKSDLCALYTAEVTKIVDGGVSGLTACASGRPQTVPDRDRLRRVAALLFIENVHDDDLCGRISSEITRLRSQRSLWARIKGGPDLTSRQLVVGVGAVAALAAAYVYRGEIGGAVSSAYNSVRGAINVLNGTDKSIPPAATFASDPAGSLREERIRGEHQAIDYNNARAERDTERNKITSKYAAQVQPLRDAYDFERRRALEGYKYGRR